MFGAHNYLKYNCEQWWLNWTCIYVYNIYTFIQTEYIFLKVARATVSDEDDAVSHHKFNEKKRRNMFKLTVFVLFLFT